MTETSGRIARAFRDHDSFDRVDDGRFTSTTTTFDGIVEASENDGRIDYVVRVRAPSLSAAVEDGVAAVVEEGWLETFELRVADADGVVRGDHDFEPTVELAGDELVVEFAFTDINERRGVDDAAALINYVEGTYVQGIIPGYEYVDPVGRLVDRARQAGGR
ncbi:DUF5813 family protein [Haloplanus aerogenes]|uniref:Uncharacterized protein n=1 Tax=Haloplanus aerogenes TaxID=660522 RepID=A0A3M0CTQ3_9EURY|nr:DUF5813 family protein [Haloplanus aerogenes]AZH26628.1 hypothetical protein DU502_15145 [Haloplanus aerogenes]RMB12861.1 hypothetical protein ATH50_3017 [Haloplanus aerogenes]